MFPNPFAQATVPSSDVSRRMSHLTAAARRWLAHSASADSVAAAGSQQLARLLEDWLDEAASGDVLERLPLLAGRLGSLAPADPKPGPDWIVRAFAHALVLQAMAEVEREAVRAGHASVFSALRGFVDADPVQSELAEISRSMQMQESTILVALARLRRRLQQRIESALALWSAPGEQRDHLRRRLRESLSAPESTS